MIYQVATAAVWFCALLAAVVVSKQTRPLSSAFTFGLVAAVASQLRPEPGWIGLLVALIAGWQLVWPSSPRAGPVLAGALAGMAAALHIGAGVAPALASLAAAGALVAGLVLVRGRALGDRTNASLAISALGALVLGFAPEVASGWQSAQALSQAAATSGGTPAAIPLFVLLLILAALAAGIARGAFRR